MKGRLAVAAMSSVLGGCFDLGPNCFDEIQNNVEEGVDCGGRCKPCPVVDPCDSVTCTDGTCVEGACVPWCDNGVQDEEETDVDCGGSMCRKCAGGHTCVVDGDCFSNNCITITGLCYELVNVSFGPPVAYGASFKPYALAAGDLDGDGQIDLAVANELASTVGLYRGAGTGAFAPVPASTENGFPTGEYPTGIAIADFNRDGIPDVVTADYHGNSVSILLGAKTGTMYRLGTAARFPTVSGAETSTLAVGDLDGDMNVDVVAANPQRSSISVFMGRPNGTLAPAMDVPCGVMPGSSEPYSVAIADFDGNGTLDIAAADNRTRSVFIKLGMGNGTFVPGPEQPAIGGLGSFIMITRDMNVDGVPDLVIANRGSDDVTVLRGRGGGRFHPAVVSPAGMTVGPYSLAVADFNLDGIPDVITANYMKDNASVLLGTGSGAFKPPLDTGPVGMLPYGIAVGDFNGDGNIDFATANAVSNTVTVKLSTAE